MPDEQEPAQEAQLEVMAPSAIESIERAQIDMQIATARKYPRTISTVVRKMTELATLDEETAGSCFYRLNRQGKNIEGPSIRLAEIAVSCFGNIRFGARVIANDGKQITAQGFCHDLESNVMVAMEVKRRITNKEGRTYSEDMQTVTGNAACAIAARNAVFKVIPFAMVKPILTAAKKSAIGDIKTLTERRTRTLEKLAALGVNEKRACQAVGKAGVEDIGLEELATLFGLFNAVKEEEQTLEEAFPEIRKPIQFGEAGLPEKEKKARGKGKEKAETPPAETPAPERATPLQVVQNLMLASKIEEPALLAHLFGQNVVEQGDKLSSLSEEKLNMISTNWLEIGAAITKGE